MCIAPIHGTSSKRMPASGVLALFDHLSTYAVSEVDRTHRPGVSLTLSIELTPEHEDVLRSGTELHFACTVDKAGKSVAFVSATVTDPHGNLVATCRHTKYMPLPTGMGLMWGMAFGVAKPITESIYRHILARGDDALSVEDQDDNSKRVADVDANGNKYKSSTVQKESSNTIMHEQSNLVNDLTELIAVRNVVEVSSTDDTGHHIRGTSLPLSVRHTNPLGGLHGGCQAMLSEVLAEELVRERSPSTVLRSIYMEYLRYVLTLEACADLLQFLYEHGMRMRFLCRIF